MSYSSGRQRCGQNTSRRASTSFLRRALTWAQPVPARFTGRCRMRASVTSTRPTIRSATLKRTLYRAVRAARHPRRAAERRKIRSEVAAFVGGRAALGGYSREVRASGLMQHLFEKGREHQERVGGTGHSLGAIGYTEGVYLYSVLRLLRPEIAAATGLAYGFSSVSSVLALQTNGTG